LPVVWVATRDVPLGDLIAYPGNARSGHIPQIRASIRRHGQYRSLVVRDCPDGLVILAGNHTAEALAAEGYQAARCEVVACDDDEARRINLADNKLAELGDYDNPALLAQLTSLDEDLDATGYGLDQLDDLRSLLNEVPVMAEQPTGARWAETPGQLAEREQRISAFQPRVTEGITEMVLVMTLTERDEYVDLIRRVRQRDDDTPAGQITIAALRAWNQAALG
jgi:ParB-like chromosome segregation protein Spo0J